MYATPLHDVVVVMAIAPIVVATVVSGADVLRGRVDDGAAIVVGAGAGPVVVGTVVAVVGNETSSIGTGSSPDEEPFVLVAAPPHAAVPRRTAAIHHSRRLLIGQRYGIAASGRLMRLILRAGSRRDRVVPPMKIRTTLQLNGKTATGFQVPEEVVTSLGSGKRPPVRVTIGAHTYRSTVAPMGGVYLIGVSAENRQAAGVAAGDEIDVTIELDTEPREVTVPADFAMALDGDAAAKHRFEAMSYTHRREHVRAIEDAKTPETRQRRIDKAIAMLSR
jgi:hypothetical protein